MLINSTQSNLTQWPNFLTSHLLSPPEPAMSSSSPGQSRCKSPQAPSRRPCPGVIGVLTELMAATIGIKLKYDYFHSIVNLAHA